MKRFTEQNYPQLIGKIHGELYPPSTMAQYISTFTSSLWISGLALIFGGDSILGMLGVQSEPQVYTYIKQNKFGVGCLLFIINNMGASMMSTGAFEVYLDGKLIFSKLQLGKVPSGEDIVGLLKDHGF